MTSPGKITNTTLALTVDDVTATSGFFTAHLGYEEVMAADGFASLARSDAAAAVVVLRRGSEVLPEGFRDQHAAGLIVAFTVDDLNAEHDRLRAEGVTITMPLREEPWGERLFQVTDPNGVVVQFVEWAARETG
jgi:uncharacterized glyoxalase superfamily protein PhnB